VGVKDMDDKGSDTQKRSPNIEMSRLASREDNE
jgi:hypothetical protein